MMAGLLDWTNLKYDVDSPCIVWFQMAKNDSGTFYIAQVILILIPCLCRKSLLSSTHGEDTLIMALQAGMLLSSGCSCVTCCYLSTRWDWRTHPYTYENRAVHKSIYHVVTVANSMTDLLPEKTNWIDVVFFSRFKSVVVSKVITVLYLVSNLNLTISWQAECNLQGLSKDTCQKIGWSICLLQFITGEFQPIGSAYHVT